MARIFLSLSGEGRGHATRARALVDHLHRQHELKVFAPGLAYELLQPLRRSHAVSIERIDGLLNQYTSNGRMAYLRCAKDWLQYAATSPKHISRLAQIMRAENPTLVITDFEPLLPRAAERCGVPYMSIDHQHYMVDGNLSSLPARLRWHARWMSLAGQGFYRRQLSTVISSFFKVPVRSDRENVHQVGIFLRPAVLKETIGNNGHFLVYLRRTIHSRVLDVLRALDCPVVIYGLGARPPLGNLAFRASDESRFVSELATCRALMCTAGNQIVGEALYLGKPLLVFPEPGNYEQEINAHFVTSMGLGRAHSAEELTARVLARFLKEADSGRSPRMPSHELNGTPHAVSLINSQLSALSTATRDPQPDHSIAVHA